MYSLIQWLLLKCFVWCFLAAVGDDALWKMFPSYWAANPAFSRSHWRSPDKTTHLYLVSSGSDSLMTTALISDIRHAAAEPLACVSFRLWNPHSLLFDTDVCKNKPRHCSEYTSLRVNDLVLAFLKYLISSSPFHLTPSSLHWFFWRSLQLCKR